MSKVPFRWHRLGWHLSIWLWRPTVHWLIVKYTRAVGCRFHQGEYGANGRYIILLTDEEEQKRQNLSRQLENRLFDIEHARSLAQEAGIDTQAETTTGIVCDVLRHSGQYENWREVAE